MIEHLAQLYLLRQHVLICVDARQVPDFRPEVRGVSSREDPMKVGSYAKAIVAAAAAGTGSLFQAVGDNAITPGEWVTVALAVLGALGITAAIPNAERSDPRPRPITGPAQGSGDEPDTSGWPRLQR